MDSACLQLLHTSCPTVMPCALLHSQQTTGYIYIYIYIYTYLLTPWCRVLLEKLAGLQLVKKFPAFHGTRRFITPLTSVRHLSLSWANPIQSTYPHPTSWRSVLILSTHLRLGLPSGLFPSGFPTKTLYTPLTPVLTFGSCEEIFDLRNIHDFLEDSHLLHKMKRYVENAWSEQNVYNLNFSVDIRITMHFKVIFHQIGTDIFTTKWPYYIVQ